MLKDRIKFGDYRKAVMGAFFVTLAAGSVVLAGPSFDSSCGGQCEDQLADARAATAKYFIEDRAVEDGFLADEECVAVPGLGAMGYHYANPFRTNDLTVNASEPEVLLYEKQPSGRMRLVGVEYFAPVIVNGQPWFGPQPPPAGQFNPAPTLYGQTFDGPMPGHNAYMPWHYDFHVWIWRDNPLGMFAPFNPKVSCQ